MSTLSQNLLPRREDRVGDVSDPFFRSPQVFSVLEEAVFIEMLRLESHRAQRSGRPFLLVSISGPDLPRRSRRITFRKATRAIALCTRETDVLGWYERGRQLALLMTEIGSAKPRDVDVIVERLADHLSDSMDPETYGKLKLTYRLYPQSTEADDCDERGEGNGARSGLPRSVRRGGARQLSRGIDVLGSLCMIALLSPLFLIIALLVKLSSPGPVFFKQTRLGQYGRKFTFLKFRTMYTNSDPAIHEAYVARLISGESEQGAETGVFKMQNDPRVTPLGRFLRKSSLDELPQFINVLRDDMSLVGPRPPLPYEYERYQSWHKRRVLDLKPGITGLWQVEGRSRTTFEQMVRLDLRYGRFRCLWSDIKILLRTPLAVIGGRGAC